MNSARQGPEPVLQAEDYTGEASTRVPEPGTWLLMSAGLEAIVLRGGVRRARSPPVRQPGRIVRGCDAAWRSASGVPGAGPPPARRTRPRFLALHGLNERFGIEPQPTRALQQRRRRGAHVGSLEPVPEALVHCVRQPARPARFTRTSPEVLIADVERDFTGH